MTNDRCPSFEGCSASLCPLDKGVGTYCWYPDEPICSFRQFQRLDWVRKQRLIAKRHGSIDRYFTVKMLQEIQRVRKGIKGADPDGKTRSFDSKGGLVALRKNLPGERSLPTPTGKAR